MTMNTLGDVQVGFQGIDIKAYVAAFESANDVRVSNEVLASIRKLIVASLHHRYALESLLYEFDALEMYSLSQRLLLNAVDAGNPIACVLVGLRYLQDGHHNFSFGTRVRGSLYGFTGKSQLESYRLAHAMLKKTLNSDLKVISRRYLEDLSLKTMLSTFGEQEELQISAILTHIDASIDALRVFPHHFLDAKPQEQPMNEELMREEI